MSRLTMPGSYWPDIIDIDLWESEDEVELAVAPIPMEPSTIDRESADSVQALGAGVPQSQVVRNIRAFRTSRGYAPSRIVAAVAKGPLSYKRKKELRTLGVELLDCSSQEASAADLRLLEETRHFMSSNSPSSSGIIFISSDKDFSGRLSILQHVGYDVVLVYHEPVSKELFSRATHQLLWSDVCRAGRGEVLPLGAGSMSSVYETSPASAPSPILPARLVPGPVVTTDPSWCIDFFLVYSLLYQINQKCFHLVPGHLYPNLVFTTIRDLQQSAMVCASMPLMTNPVPDAVLLLLTPRGEVLLQLLKYINIATPEKSGLRPFRPALYYWIRCALVHDPGMCRISILGEALKRFLEGGIITSENGALFSSVSAYFSSAVTKGVFHTNPSKASSDLILTLQEPFASLWVRFKEDFSLSVILGAETLSDAACERTTVDTLITVLGNFTRDELLFLPAALILLNDKSKHKLHMFHLEKLLGFSDGQCEYAVQNAGLISGAGTIWCTRTLTQRGKDVVNRFQRALERKS